MEIGLLIKQFDNEIKNKIEKKFKALGITSTQGLIIKFLLCKNENVVQRDIEDTFNLKRSTISEALSLMEKNNLIERKKSGRTNIIVPTSKAKGIHEDILNLLIEIENEIRKNISNDELDLFINILGRMKNNLKEDIKNA